MIQLKPGIPPASLNGPPQPTVRRRNRSDKKKKTGLRFKRVFSDAAVAPFDQVEWERRTAEITDDSAKVIFKQEDIEVPKSWSALATKIAVSKYFYGDIANGTDPYKGGRERSMRQLIHRVTRTITDWGIADSYFADTEAAETFYDELTWLCLNQHGAFNSPVWFNVGLYHQYGVGKGAGAGNYFYNRETGEAERAESQYEYPQGSACFIQSVGDTMEDIMRLATSEAMLFKFGSGTGTDLSSLRSTREKLSGGGKPSEKQDARSLLRKIAEGTWICGDPGMQFDTTIHKWHTCKGTDRQNSTNPCSEYLFLDNTACNLASLNLIKFKTADGDFDVERFKAAVRIFITAQEIIVDHAS